MRETFDITGMTCAACSSRVQKAAGEVPGVASASVNLLKNSMELDYDGSPETAAAVVEAIEKSGYGAARRMPAGEKRAAPAERPGAAAERATREKRDQLLVSAVFSVPLFYVAMGPMFGWPQPPAIAGESNLVALGLTQLLLCAPILLVNRHYFITGFRTLVRRAPNMDSLIALGSSASAAWSIAQLYRMAWAAGAGDVAALHDAAHSLYFDSAGMILTLITLGKYFEARAKGRTTDAIAALMDLAPRTATVVRDGEETEVPTEDVRVGERVIVRAGESVPVDGVVVESTVLSSEVISEPVTQVTREGTKDPNGWATIESDGTVYDENGNEVVYKKLLSGRCSAYTGGGTTATGAPAAFGRVAVNPNVIPYGTKLYICSPDGKVVYGYAIASDTGGACMRNTIIADLYYDTLSECYQIGVRTMNVYIL